MPTNSFTTTESDNFETVTGDQLDQAAGGYYYPGGNYPGGNPGGNPGGRYGNGEYGRQPQYYTVQRGDNLTNIAKDSGRSLNYILNHNPQFQANPNLIYPGQHVFTGWNHRSYS
ncbi:MAG TPA: LysM peptidoglycan-binding domain-containing protein [Kofleriaceae bacterium]|nr:LysM peptidoglycan-binding domain-containing protein [Kofleriaceae bacterium]